ncbi:hypothetical protein UFOVP14_32 [uncultured Caudovirales phage]|uniref:Uncharacterized protein n=1 Tax=uncultured Caudovirales phage TaxID=2100421 RepID=A0A6J5KN57_9CAUD|nr:hypothetical protein UFOVP14_32 [uncultured Caudovirales phage]
MNISDFTPQSMLFKVIAWVGIVGIVIGSLFALSNHFESIGYDRRVAEDQVSLNKDLIDSKDKSQALQHQLNEAQNALAKAKSDLFALNNLNRNAINGLRSNFATFNGSLSIDTRETISKRISSLSNMVEDCSARLVEVANDADTAIAEIQMLEKAWPK